MIALIILAYGVIAISQLVIYQHDYYAKNKTNTRLLLIITILLEAILSVIIA